MATDMSDDLRARRAQRKAVRGRAERLGARRAKIMRDLDAVHDELVELVPAARGAQVPITEVADLIGVSTPALYGLVKRRARRAAQ